MQLPVRHANGRRIISALNNRLLPIWVHEQYAYERGKMKEIFLDYVQLMRSRQQTGHDTKWTGKRNFNGATCGFCNNWFIGELEFFLKEDVQHFLKWVDRESYMYRNRTNDLVIQTDTVITFAEAKQIQCFLDWT